MKFSDIAANTKTKAKTKTNKTQAKTTTLSGKESGSCTRFLAGTVVEVSLLGNEASRFYRFLLGKRQDVSR